MSGLRAVASIVRRDWVRAFRQKGRLLGGLVRPFMWLILVGTGYNAIAHVQGAGSYRAFLLPGLVVMASLFGAMLTAIGTVYDREFGMLRLMLASPAGVPAILTGRALAAALIGGLQGLIVLAFVPFAIQVSAWQLVFALLVLAVCSGASAVLGLLVAAPIRSVENFAGVINVVLFPLLFSSGALYPTEGMPRALRILTAINPVSYEVDLMRGALGLPAEFGLVRSLGALGFTIIAGFAATVVLFDSEQRLAVKRRPAV